MDMKNLSVVRQQFAQCVFNHKIHEKAADRLGKYENLIKGGNVIFLGFDLLFLILGMIKNNEVLFYLSMSLTVIEILFVFIQTIFSVTDKILLHKTVAIQYMGLRDKYKNLIADIMNNKIESKSISKIRDLLQDQYQIISSINSETTIKDYINTQKALIGTTKTDEEFTWSDKEINRFLPKHLHI